MLCSMVIGSVPTKILQRINLMICLDIDIFQDGKSDFDFVPGLKVIYKKRSMKEQGREWPVSLYESDLY